METNKDFYNKLLVVISNVCDVDIDVMFENNLECNVDARSLLILQMSTEGYTDMEIAVFTGLTRQAINHIKNTYHNKLNRNCKLITYQQQIVNEIKKT